MEALCQLEGLKIPKDGKDGRVFEEKLENTRRVVVELDSVGGFEKRLVCMLLDSLKI